MSNVSSSPAEGDASNLPPAAKPRKHTWGVIPTFLLIVLGFSVLPVVAGVLLAFVPKLLGWDSIRADEWLLDSPVAQFLFVLLSEAMTIGAIAWFIAHKKASFFSTVGLLRPKGRDVGYIVGGILAYLGLFVVALMLVNAVLPINTDQEQALGFERSITGVGLVLAFVSLVVLPPLAEEIVFRGFLYGTLRANKLGVGWSIFITSAIFGALHLFGAADGKLLWIAFLDTFVLSLVLCYVREKTGSLWASIGIHALKNGFVFLNLFIINAT